MTIKCPYCKNEAVGVYAGKLVHHPAIKAWPHGKSVGALGSCIGSGEYVDKARELNEAHERTRQTVGRIR